MSDNVLNIIVSLLKSETFKQIKRKVYYSLFIIGDIKICRHLVIEIASNRFNASCCSITMQDLAYTIGSNDSTGFQNRFVKRVFFAFDSGCRFLPSPNTTKTPKRNSSIISAALDSRNIVTVFGHEWFCVSCTPVQKYTWCRTETRERAVSVLSHNDFSPAFINSLFYPLHVTIVPVSASRHNHKNTVHMFCNFVILVSHPRIKRDIDFYGLFIRVIVTNTVPPIHLQQQINRHGYLINRGIAGLRVFPQSIQVQTQVSLDSKG
jgi:hypothetical protein